MNICKRTRAFVRLVSLYRLCRRTGTVVSSLTHNASGYTEVVGSSIGHVSILLLGAKAYAADQEKERVRR